MPVNISSLLNARGWRNRPLTLSARSYFVEKKNPSVLWYTSAPLECTTGQYSSNVPCPACLSSSASGRAREGEWTTQRWVYRLITLAALFSLFCRFDTYSLLSNVQALCSSSTIIRFIWLRRPLTFHLDTPATQTPCCSFHKGFHSHKERKKETSEQCALCVIGGTHEAFLVRRWASLITSSSVDVHAASFCSVSLGRPHIGNRRTTFSQRYLVSIQRDPCSVSWFITESHDLKPGNDY